MDSDATAVHRDRTTIRLPKFCSGKMNFLAGAAGFNPKNHLSRELGRQPYDSHVLVVMGRGNAEAVGVEVHVAGQAG
jgi:hypothetical protein